MEQKSKKKFKEDYKQMRFPMGVFQIRNISNDKILIDNSIDMPSKWNRHKFELNFGSHKNRELQKDWNEKGEDNFVFEILSELKYDDENQTDYNKELKVLQKMVIEELNISENLRY
ncbi:MAG: GIY-YIG nuclease family protein [Saprospiraceae bacterium]